jgi:hypothetical protein
MNSIHGEQACSPFPFSNDHWQRRTVREMQRRMNHSSIPAERSAALVVGSGGLPYLFSRLNVGRIFNVDLSQEVLSITSWRVGMLQEHTGWARYHQAMSRELERRGETSSTYKDEQKQAYDSGLQGRYRPTKRRAAEIDLVSIEGDLRERAGYIGALAADKNCEITFVNVTNVATYTDMNRIYLNEALDNMPVAADAVIVDSAPELHPRLYTRQGYRDLMSARPCFIY